ncbi:unnamed protein product, partial [Mesorhabditis spiculigera]
MLGGVSRGLLLRAPSSYAQACAMASASVTFTPALVLQNPSYQRGRQRRPLYTTGPTLASKDYYKLLGISKESSAKDIKKAYFQMAKKYHPDVNKTKEAQERFQEVSEAYEVLSDEGKRKEYDTYGTADGQQRQRNNMGRGGGAGHGGFNFGGKSTEEFFRQTFGFGSGGINWDSYADSSFGYAPAQEVEVRLSFEDAVRGTTRSFDMNVVENCGTCQGTQVQPGYKKVSCPYCNGTGMVSQRIAGGFYFQQSCTRCQGSGSYNKNPCTECTGKGKTVQQRKVDVKIPPGVNDKERMQLSVGQETVILYMSVAPSSVFRRDRNDVHCDVEISIGQAVLGGTVKVPGVYEDGYIKIPAGTNSHTKMMRTGKGIKRLNQHGYGDQYINIKIAVPKFPSKEQKKIITTFAKTETLQAGTVNLFEEPPKKIEKQQEPVSAKAEKPSETPKASAETTKGPSEAKETETGKPVQPEDAKTEDSSQADGGKDVEQKAAKS